MGCLDADNKIMGYVTNKYRVQKKNLPSLNKNTPDKNNIFTQCFQQNKVHWNLVALVV